MNMQRLVLINYAFDTEVSYGGQGGRDWLSPALVLRTSCKAQIPPPSLPITMSLQNASLAPSKHNSLIFTESGVLPIASLTARLAGLEGPSGSEQACARLGDLLQAHPSWILNLDFSGAPAAEKLTPGCVIYLSFKAFTLLQVGASSGQVEPASCNKHWARTQGGPRFPQQEEGGKELCFPQCRPSPSEPISASQGNAVHKMGTHAVRVGV